MFSIPLNPKLTEKEFQNFLEFLKRNKSLIYDFYFTCRIAPFHQDAMGDTLVNEAEDSRHLIDVALYVQRMTGITASAVFNNIEVRPSQQNLDLWINSFAPLYEAGIRSATIPHTHWLATGQIQTRFPELFIKNTILRNVSEPRDIEKLAKAGFHYINLDRDLMRDHEKLLRFKKAKEKYGVKLSLLANEGCAGGCIMMDEHYQFNNTRITTTPQYFNDPISRVSCPKWDHEDPAMPLKTANFPPWRADWQEFFDLGIDVIKMHGRESTSRLRESMMIIDKYAAGEEILFESFKGFIEETNLVDKPIDVWRKKIKNCKFDCWDCGFCDKIYNAKYGKTQHPLVGIVTQELVDSVNVEMGIDIPGLTSNRVQALINGLAGKAGSYLEVGSYLGATGAAALKANSIDAYFVDNWKQDVTPVTQETPNVVENKKDKFINNIRPYIGSNNVTLFDSHMFAVNTDQIKDINLFFYDGPHDQLSTQKAVEYYKDCLAETAILIFDDANWDGVVKGAAEGIKRAGLTTIYSKMLLNEVESKNEWWNGLFIVVVTKQQMEQV